MRRPLLRASTMVVALLLFSVGAAPSKEKDSDSSALAVEFTDCIESIGVGLIPTEQAEALVPSQFHVAGEGQPVTPLVVRTADCGIAVEGHRPKAGSIVQIGVVIVPPDFTGDINNYTLLYYTTDAKLANLLQRLGVDAQHVPTIHYDYEPDGSGNPSPLVVAVPRPGSPRLLLDGNVVASDAAAGSFEANWWVKTHEGIVKMDTQVPRIFIGAANLELTTESNSGLGHLIGGSSTGFPVLQQFNTFPSASMKVSLASH